MSSFSNINSNFFFSSYKDVWKKTIPTGLTEAEVDFLQEIARLNEKSHVLDIMCGYGRHSLELARRGIRVTAVDNLAEYIDEIKDTAIRENLVVNAIHGDVLDTSLTEFYDLAVCMGNSFAFFNRKQTIDILKNISRHLKSEGLCVIHSEAIAEIAIKQFRERDWFYVDSYKCIFEFKYSSFPSRIEFEQTIISADGTTERLQGIDYIYTLDDMEEMFSEAGFKTKQLFSTPRKKKFALGDSRIYIVAEKI
jgi:cyclopropane fatty-acyl-phospholipid synthase-like methyltransferase